MGEVDTPFSAGGRLARLVDLCSRLARGGLRGGLPGCGLRGAVEGFRLLLLEGVLRGGRGLLVLGHAPLEALDAFGDVAHDGRYFAAAAEQEQNDRQQKEPVPDAV